MDFSKIRTRLWTAALGLLVVCLFSVSIFGDTAATEPTTPAGTSPSGGQTKPSLRLLADGFPGGHDTPEGAACDLARAFIGKDSDLFEKTCLPPFGSGDDRKAYEDFLQQAEAGIKAEAGKAEPSSGGPKVIGKVFAARHLSHDGPASYGYATFNFSDVMFVDVGVITNGGKRMLCRTLVIQTSDGKWVVDPDPAAHPLLSEGLNGESRSKQDFSEVYTIQK